MKNCKSPLASPMWGAGRRPERVVPPNTKSATRKTSFLRRLQIAWLVLIGKIPVAPSGQLPAGLGVLDEPPVVTRCVSYHPIRLVASWWCPASNLEHTRRHCIREVCKKIEDDADELMQIREEPTPDGGYNVSASLYLYKKDGEPEC